PGSLRNVKTKCSSVFLFSAAFLMLSAAAAQNPPTVSPALAKPAPVTLTELARMKTSGVSVAEVSDYVFGNYRGDFPSPPHADGNPKKAFVVYWKNLAYRFVFSH